MKNKTTLWGLGLSKIAMLLSMILGMVPLYNNASAADIDLPVFGTNRPPAQTFYLPIPEDNLLTALNVISSVPRDPVQIYISLAVFVDGTFIYFDQWENGYDRDIANPNNLYSSTNLGGTQIWGDGDPSNGFPPGYPSDVLSAGDVIILANAVNSTTRQTVIDWDAGDKIGATKPIAVTSAVWASGSNTLLAGANEVYDTAFFGTEFQSPVGTDSPDSYQMFEYSALMIMASADNTEVKVDADRNGTFEQVITINEGETVFVNGGVRVGGRVLANKPVQVDLLTGDIGSNYESRFFRLLPTSTWTSALTAPVASATTVGDSPSGTTVWLYNPTASSITVRQTYRKKSSSTTLSTRDWDVPANGNASVTLTEGCAARFESTTGANFYALSAIDSTAENSNGSGNQTWDWGYALIPDDALTPQVLVGLGIGRDPTSSTSPNENGSPVWVTPIGNGDTKVRVYVDYDSDPTTGSASGVDANGNKYDAYYDLRELVSQKIFNPSGDQTGVLIYTVADGVKLAAAWGADPENTSPGSPGLDFGTGIPPLPAFFMQKTSTLHADSDGDGYITPNDVIRYDILIENIGRQPVTDLRVRDVLPAAVSYVLGSTTFTDKNGVVSPIADLPANPKFPLGTTGGYLLPGFLPIASTWHISYDTQVGPFNANSGLESIQNKASVSSGGITYTNGVIDALRGRVGDYVWLDSNMNGIQDAGETGVNGVSVRLLNADGTQALNDFDVPYEFVTRTGEDGDGFYLFTGVRPGQYIVEFSTPSGYVFTQPNEGGSADKDSDAGTGATPNATEDFRLDGGQFKLDVDAGLIKLGSISGSVLIDQNGDGIVDSDDTAPVFGVTVSLLNTSGTVVATTTTQADGSYSFTGLLPGSYTVRETDLTGWVSTKDMVGANDNLIGAILGFGQDSVGNNFYDTIPVSIGDRVWVDTNRNGIQDAGELGLVGVTVQLLKNGIVAATTTTDANGNYLFENKNPGTYSVKFVPPTGYAFTLQNMGANDAVDSDAGAADGTVAAFTIPYGTVDRKVDAGVYRPTTGIEIVKTAGNAADGTTLTINGVANVVYTYVVKNTGETYLSILNVNDNKLGDVGTISGPLAPNATATLTLTATNVSATVVNIGTVTANPTDATGTDLPGFDNVTDTDDAKVVVIPYASIGDFVWVDLNANGIQDASEPGLSGVTVKLYKDGSQVATTTTGSNGGYLFENLLEGSYSVGFTTPYGYSVTTANVGDDVKDSDIAATGLTSSFPLVGGANRTDIDAGYVRKSASVEIVKTADNAADGTVLSFQGTNDVIYTYTVKNTGSTYLNLDVDDDKIGIIGMTPALLAPGATATGTKTATAVSEDVVNVGTVTGTPSDSNGTSLTGFTPVTDTDDASVVVIPYSSIGNFVWNDLNKNGIQDAGELGLAGFAVTLYKGGVEFATTTSDANGGYSFGNLFEGDYSLKFTPTSTYWASPRDVGSDATDSDIDAAGVTASFNLGAGINDTTRDAGFYRPTASVEVVKTAGAAADGTTLTINGSASVTYTYVVKNTGETYLSISSLEDDKLGAVEPIDGLLAPGATKTLTKTATAISTNVINVVTVTANPTDEAGADLAGLADVTDTDDARVEVIPYSSIGDFAWVDLNGNGIQDIDEPGLPNVGVVLYKDGTQIATTTTDANGGYLFETLLEGSYSVGFTTPYGYAITTANVGNTALNSDIATDTGRTSPFPLVGGANRTDVDAGYTRLAASVQVMKTAGDAADGTALTFQGTSDVVYSYVVKNTGSTYLNDFVVTDDKLGAIGPIVEPLAPGATTTLTQTATAISADVVNLVTVTAKPSDSVGTDLVGFGNVTDSDDASVVVVPYSFIGDFVWNDLNKDGVQDAGEPGLAGVTVTLYTNGVAFASTTTDTNGGYGFNNLFAGSYSLAFTRPSSYTATTANFGDDAADSDIDANGVIAPFNLGAGVIDRTYDAGFVLLVASVEVVKTAGNAADGETLTVYGSSNVVYTYVVKNTGETYLSNVVVTDDKLGEVGTIDGPLAPGATETLTKTASAISANVINVATVTANPTEANGDDLDGLENVTDTDDASVKVIPYSSIGDKVWIDVNADGIQDAGEPGLAGVTVQLFNTNGTVVATTTTDANGNYLFQNLLEGSYLLGFTTPYGYAVTTANVGGDATDSDIDPTTGRTDAFALSTGINDVTRDAGFTRLNASVEIVKTAGAAPDGTVLSFQGITNVVYTYTVKNTGSTYLSNLVVTDDKLDAIGTIEGPLAPGESATLTKTAIAVSADVVNVGTVTGKPSDSSGDELVGFTEVRDTDDASVVIIPYSSIGDFVWNDLNKDGVQNAGEPALAGVTVQLLNANGTVVATTSTDANGEYTFGNLFEGDYALKFTPTSTYWPTLRDVGADSADSDIDATGLTASFQLGAGVNDTTRDAGFYRPTASVEVVKTAGDAADGTTLIINGSAAVTYTYVVKNTGETYLSISSLEDDKLGGIEPIDGLLAPGATKTVTKTAPAISASVINVATVTATPTDEAGADLDGLEDVTDTDDARVEVTPYSSIGDFVWVDLNGDGIQDAGEPGLAGVAVVLYTNGVVVASMTTDADGKYAFVDLLEGSYQVGFSTLPGYRPTAVDVGGDDADSDLDLATGRTSEFTLEPGVADNTRDAGFVLLTAGVEIVKTAGDAPDGQVLSFIGSADVLYTYVLKNIGETYLKDLIVNDDKLLYIGTVTGPLAPNETAILYATTNALSESVTNIGTVVATPTDSEGTVLVALTEVSDTDDAVVEVTPETPTPDPTICELLDFGKPFNAVIFGNLNVTGGDTEGNLLVWGNASLPAGYSVGHNNVESQSSPMPVAGIYDDALIVGGDLYIGPQGINGNVVYGGNYSGFDRVYQPYAVRHVTPVTLDATGNVPEDHSGLTREEMLAKVNEVSARVSVWAERGVVAKTNTVDGSLFLVGDDPERNIFDITAEQWSGAVAIDRTINVPVESTVIINIRGLYVNISGGQTKLPVGMTPNQVLIHYVDAETITVSSFTHEGSVLASVANATFSGGSVQGVGIFGGNVTTSTGFEFHNFPMNVFDCPTYPSVRLVTTANDAHDGYVLKIASATDILVRQTVINTGSSWLRSITLTEVDGSVVNLDDLAPNGVAFVETTIHNMGTDTVYTASVVAKPSNADGSRIDGFSTLTASDIAAVVFYDETLPVDPENPEDPNTPPTSTGKADLGIAEGTNIWFMVQPTTTGEVFSVSVKVENRGDETSTRGKINLYLVDLSHSLTNADPEEVPEATFALGTFIPGEIKVFTFKGLISQAVSGHYRVVVLVDPDDEIPEYSNGDNHGSLYYWLAATTLQISIGTDGITLTWNNDWGQVYTIMVSQDLEEWQPHPDPDYQGIPSTRDDDRSIENTVTLPFTDDAQFFKLRVDR